VRCYDLEMDEQLVAMALIVCGKNCVRSDQDYGGRFQCYLPLPEFNQCPRFSVPV